MLKASAINVPSYDAMFGAKFSQNWSCGFPAIDKCGFLRPGEVTVLLSRASRMRSALAMNLAAKLALQEENDGGVLVVSPRIAADEYLAAMAKMMANVNDWRLVRGLVTKAERAAESARYDEAVVKLKGSRLYFEDDVCVEPDEILSAAQSACREGGLSLVIVDQLQDIGCGPLKNGSVGWGIVGSRLHQLATTYQVPVMVLSGSALDGSENPGVFRGYGCFQEYVDQIVEFSRIWCDGDEDTATFVLRHTYCSDCEPGAKILVNRTSLRIVDCQEWRKEPVSDPPEPIEETK